MYVTLFMHTFIRCP